MNKQSCALNINVHKKKFCYKNLFQNWIQEFGFDVNQKTDSEKTPLMVAMESKGSEHSLVYFMQQVCDESKNFGRPVDLNVKNKSGQSVPW